MSDKIKDEIGEVKRENSIVNVDELRTYSPEQLAALQQSINDVRMDRIEARLMLVVDDVKKVKDGQSILKDEFMTEIEKRDNTYQKQMDVAVNSVRLVGRNNKGEYVKQTDLGKKYLVNISSVSMGTLLRLSGIAFRNRKTTTPKMQSCGKYCIVDPVTDKYGNTRESYSWHRQNCMDAIDKWLKENDCFEEFYSIGDQNEMKEYIKLLARKHDVAC